jgi:hypothetical protein
MIKTARGAKTYEGRPCKRGHSGTRYAANHNCIPCALESVRDSEWQRVHHLESNRKSARRYRAKNRELLRAKDRLRAKKRRAARRPQPAATA